MSKSVLVATLGLASVLAVGCRGTDPYRDTSGITLAKIDYDDVRVYDTAPPKFEKIGEIHFVQHSPRGRADARELAREKLKRTAASHGTNTVVIVREQVQGGSDPRGDASVRMEADAGRVP